MMSSIASISCLDTDGFMYHVGPVAIVLCMCDRYYGSEHGWLALLAWQHESVLIASEGQADATR